MKTNRNQLILIFVILVALIGVYYWLSPQKPKWSLDDNMPVVTNSVMIYWSKDKGSEIVTDPVVRQLEEEYRQDARAMLTYSITELLKGPSEAEQDAGFFSEIPEGTRLLSIEETKDGFYVNLSEEFATGGGSTSMVQRLQELTKTIVAVPQKKPVYLQIEGKLVETLGGEGVMVHEPITAEPSVTR